MENNIVKFDKDTPAIVAANKVQSVMAVNKDTGEVGNVAFDLLVNEAGKNIADAVKVTGNVLPTLGTANKRYSFTTDAAGRTLTHGASSFVFAGNKQCSVFWDGTAKVWSKEDEVELPKGADANLNAFEVNSDIFIWAITDSKDKVLIALKRDGSLFWSKGVSEELDIVLSNINSEITTLKKDIEVVTDWKVVNNNSYLFAIVDHSDKVIYAIDKDLNIVNKSFEQLKNRVSDIESILSNFSPDVNTPLFRNTQLPKGKLKILLIGNSFTNDMITMVNEMAKSAGITDLVIGKLIYGGCSLQQHWDFYRNNSSVYDYGKSINGGAWVNTASSSFMQSIIDEDWDVVILQQVSQNSGQWNTIEPYIYNLIDAVVTNCKNPGVTLGWHSTWAYATNSPHTGFPNYDKDQIKMYNAIQDVSKKIINETGIDLIIPSGTAIQNLRTTSVNNPPDDLTADGYHLSGGVARLVASYVFIDSILAPVYGISSKNNGYTPSGGTVSVNPANKALASLASRYAVSRRFEISKIETKVNVNN